MTNVIKNMSEKIVSDQTQDKALKPKERKKPIRAEEPWHIDEAKGKKGDEINKYGFLHINKDLTKHLGVKFGRDKTDAPVAIERIESGFVVKVVKT
jgi:hypothetical protein